jgi:hypothetical protein
LQAENAFVHQRQMPRACVLKCLKPLQPIDNTGPLGKQFAPEFHFAGIRSTKPLHLVRNRRTDAAFRGLRAFSFLSMWSLPVFLVPANYGHTIDTTTGGRPVCVEPEDSSSCLFTEHSCSQWQSHVPLAKKGVPTTFLHRHPGRLHDPAPAPCTYRSGSHLQPRCDERDRNMARLG